MRRVGLWCHMFVVLLHIDGAMLVGDSVRGLGLVVLAWGGDMICWDLRTVDGVRIGRLSVGVLSGVMRSNRCVGIFRKKLQIGDIRPTKDNKGVDTIGGLDRPPIPVPSFGTERTNIL